MVINNHFESNRKKLDGLLRTDNTYADLTALQRLRNYAETMAEIENVIVVVSDMANGKSHISAGEFARSLGISDYQHEDSIWENRILSLMSAEEQEAKYIAELSFFHFVKHQPKNRKGNYHLLSKLRFRFGDGSLHDVFHRMHYIYDDGRNNVRYAVCIYGPLSFDFKGRSMIVNSVTGITEEITPAGRDAILSKRERQVLSLIDTGMKSAEIADKLNISTHTVSRHRQEIIKKLQVKNTHEACRIAKSMELI
ncbi:MAG: helix-turn-helix transcriptional regulator [Muribaculaceae bacterium]|nr:helix-turn-helix transcriptional regulator [Muribaculaceae bacterium]